MSEARLIGSGTMDDPYRLAGAGDYSDLHIDDGRVTYRSADGPREIALPAPVEAAYAAREAIKELS